MRGTYEDCKAIARSHRCSNCQDKSILVVRHTPSVNEATSWEVYCPGCQEREHFIKPESLTARWRRDPDSVSVAVANKLEKKYGGNPMSDQALTTISKKEMIERIDGARWAHQLTPAQVLTVAEVAVRYGYDPLMGEITVYEGKIYITLDGALRDAKRTPNFQGIQTLPLTQEEREARGIKQPIAYKAELYRADWKVPAVGIGVADPANPFRNNPVERSQPHTLAESRAIRRAVRLAREAPGAIIREIDFETGEILVPNEPSVEAESVREVVPNRTAQTEGVGSSEFYQDSYRQFQEVWLRLPAPLREAADAWRVQIEQAATLPVLAEVIGRLNANKASVKQAIPALSSLAALRKEDLEDKIAHEADAE